MGAFFCEFVAHALDLGFEGFDAGFKFADGEGSEIIARCCGRLGFWPSIIPIHYGVSLQVAARYWRTLGDAATAI